MLIKLNRKRKGQSTAEYAILIGLVIAAAVAMQIYVKRGLQARVWDASRYLSRSTNKLDNASCIEYQYEPYYLVTNFDVNRGTNAVSNLLRGGNISAYERSTTNRATGGYQQYQFNATTDRNK